MTTGNNSFKCRICESIFPSRNKLFHHIQSVHNSNNPSDLPQRADTDRDSIPELTIAYDDDYCRVIVKPQGMATMGQSKTTTVHNHPDLVVTEKLENSVKYHRMTPCHRLDVCTGGLVILSKNKLLERIIRCSFEYKWNKKRYMAIVAGKLEPNEGVFTYELSGQQSLTRYEVLNVTKCKHQYDYVTTVNLWPITGRTHQLRRHCQMAGHPILGDRRYSFAEQWPDERLFDKLFLWAVELTFPDPGTLFRENLVQGKAGLRKDANFMEQLKKRRKLETAGSLVEASDSSADNIQNLVDDGDSHDDFDDREIIQPLPDNVPMRTVKIEEPEIFEQLRSFYRE